MKRGPLGPFCFENKKPTSCDIGILIKWWVLDYYNHIIIKINELLYMHI